MTKKKSKYIPKDKFNPVVQAQRIEKNRQELRQLKQTITIITESNERHYQLLGNFARHDIKNILINLNSITELYKSELPDEVLESIKLNTASLSTIISNLSKLIPHSDSVKFKFTDLLVAVRILTSPITNAANISCTIEYDKDEDIELHLPFQGLLQMINNLVVNAVKALENNSDDKNIRIYAAISEDNLIFNISDNGIEIPKQNQSKIFNFAFTTTGGSGIGLNHAEYLCKLLNGKICLNLNNTEGATKTFEITIPI